MSLCTVYATVSISPCSNRLKIHQNRENNRGESVRGKIRGVGRSDPGLGVLRPPNPSSARSLAPGSLRPTLL